MAINNFLTIEFPNGRRDYFHFTSDNLLSDEELIDAAKEFDEEVCAGKPAFIGVWEDVELMTIKKFIPVNKRPNFSTIQEEYIAALAWKKLTDIRVEHALSSLTDYDPLNHETAIDHEETVFKEVGNTRAIAYLNEVEDRLLKECHEDLKRLPAYASQAKQMEWLFSKAQTNPVIRKKAVAVAATTRYR